MHSHEETNLPVDLPESVILWQIAPSGFNGMQVTLELAN